MVEYRRADEFPEEDVSLNDELLPQLGYEVLRNEFAEVAVRVDHNANGPRLQILDVRSGSMMFLDPFELCGLAVGVAEELADMFDVLVTPP